MPVQRNHPNDIIKYIVDAVTTKYDRERGIKEKKLSTWLDFYARQATGWKHGWITMTRLELRDYTRRYVLVRVI